MQNSATIMKNLARIETLEGTIDFPALRAERDIAGRPRFEAESDEAVIRLRGLHKSYGAVEAVRSALPTRLRCPDATPSYAAPPGSLNW